MSELNGGGDRGGESAGDKTKAKTVELQEQTTAIYYPSPYASVQVTSGTMTMNGNHYNGHGTMVGTLKPMTVVLENRLANGSDAGSLTLSRLDESPYATVKRTPRLPKADRNIYDYPGKQNSN